MKHFKIAHIALGTALLGSGTAVAYLAVAPPLSPGKPAGIAHAPDNSAALIRKIEHLGDPLVIVSPDVGRLARPPVSRDREPMPTFNLPVTRAPAAAQGAAGGGGGGGTGNGALPIFVSNAGPYSGPEAGSGGVDLRQQVGGGGGRAMSTDTGGPGGAGPGGNDAPPGGDPGGGSGAAASGGPAGVMSAATVTTSGNLDVAGGFTDVVPQGGNWTIGQDLNVGSGGTGNSTLNAAGAVKVRGSLNVGSATGTSLSTVVIGATGSISVANAVNVFPNGQLQINGPLIGAQAVNVSGGDVQVNVPTSINALNVTAGQIGGAGEVIVTGQFNVSGADNKALTGPLTTRASALWTGAGNILLGNGGSISNYGTFVVEATGAMELSNNATASSVFVNQSTGVFHVENKAAATMAVPFINYGQVNVQDATLVFAGGANGYVQTGISSRTSVGDGGTISSAQPLVFKGGYIKGSGTYAADIENSGATLAAGASPGHLTIQGNYKQSDMGIFNEQIEGATPGTLYDVVSVTGVATLGGTLQVTTLGGFVPTPTDTFRFLDAGTIQQDLKGLIFGLKVDANNGAKVDVMTDVTDTPGVSSTLVGTFTLDVVLNADNTQSLILDHFEPANSLKPPAPVPEPASLLLLGVGALGLLKRRNRR